MPAPAAVERILRAAPSPENPAHEPAIDADPQAELELALAPPQQNARAAAGPVPGLGAGLDDAIWRANELGAGRSSSVPTGFQALDRELPEGGWPCGSLVEVLQAQPSLLEWRLVGPSLQALISGGRSVVVIGPPKRPHLAGLRHLGLDEARLVWIKAEAPSERLWATEQLVRANAAGAVLTWLPQARPEQLRRLQVLAQSCEGPVFVFRPVAARHDPSPAPLRLLASTLFDWQVQIQILKRRGPVHENPLVLDSLPGGLHHVLTARTLKPSLLLPSKETPHAVGRPAPVDSSTARTPAPAPAEVRTASHG